jgi:type IV pilus assembly protein PilX
MATTKKMHRRDQGGFVLIASMLMLIVLAFMAVSMYHSFTTQENMSSNTKEKGRTFQMAQSTLQAAEYGLLTAGLDTPITDCSTLNAPQQNFTICNSNTNNNVVVNKPSGSSGWSISSASGFALQYNPTLDDSNISVTSTSIGQNTFYTDPLYYIQYLGAGQSSSCAGTTAKLYQVTALAYGATNSTIAAVQSTYQLVPTSCNLGSP